MSKNLVVNISFSILICFILAGCGLGSPSNGHNPYAPLPVLISDKTQVLVNHSTGAIISTPDGQATLSISQSALNANTSFEIEPYGVFPSNPKISVVQMYSFSPVVVPTLIVQQFLIVTLSYDESSIPTGTSETDLRLGVFDSVKNCWSQVLFDSAPVLPGHSVTSKDLTSLGIFGITSLNTPICPNPPMTF